MAISMTRAEYQAKYGQVPDVSSTTQPIKMTRAEYQSKYGVAPTTTTPMVQVENKPSLLQRASDVVSSIFPGKQVGQSIGTLAGLGISKAQGTSDFYNTEAPSPLQVAGDVAQGALTVAAPNIGTGGTALGRIAANSALGVGLGSTGAVSEGQGAGDVAKAGVIGGVAGGVISAGTEAIGSLVRNAPRWFAKSALPKLDDKNIEFALQKPIGSTKNMLDQSNKSAKIYNSQIDNILSHPQYATDTGVDDIAREMVNKHLITANTAVKELGKKEINKLGGMQSLIQQTKTDIADGLLAEGKTEVSKLVSEIDLSKIKNLDELSRAIKVRTSLLGDVINKVPNAQLDENGLVNVIKRVAPNNKSLVDKVIDGKASLFEKNTLRKELDMATRKAYTDNPQLTFNKSLGKAFADSLRNNVQTAAPETAPIFSEFSKELDLNKVLRIIEKKNDLKPTWQDFASAYAGYQVGGVKGALGGLLTERVLKSTGAKMGIAKGIQTLGKTAPNVGDVVQGVKAPITNLVTGD